jgi:hypothetical protein
MVESTAHRDERGVPESATSRARSNAMSSAQEAAEPWSDWIGPLTHELRQEVSAVLHQVELLKSSSLDELTRRRSLGAIEDNAECLMAFVDDLVCLGRVTRGEVRASCRPVDLDDLIDGAGRDRARQFLWTRPSDRASDRASDGAPEGWSTSTDPIIIDQIVTLLLDRYDREGLDSDAVVSAYALSADDGFIDVVFAADPPGPSEPGQFRSAIFDDGLSLYLARKTAELVGADVGVQRSGRRDSFLLRLPQVTGA